MSRRRGRVAVICTFAYFLHTVSRGGAFKQSEGARAVGAQFAGAYGVLRFKCVAVFSGHQTIEVGIVQGVSRFAGTALNSAHRIIQIGTLGRQRPALGGRIILIEGGLACQTTDRTSRIFKIRTISCNQ